MTLVPAALAALALLAPEVERTRGVARFADGRVAYVEEHEVELRDGHVARVEVRYLDAGGRPMGWSRSTYGSDPYAPDFEFHDLRTGNRHLVRRSPGDLLLAEGLERYARDNLDRLARGEVLSVLLAVPGHLGAYAFRLRAERAGGMVRVHLEPESFFLRLLAPEIAADFDPASGRLVHYRGVSNLSGDDGSSMSVEIAYGEGGVS